MSVTSKTNSAAIGITASVASRTHGEAIDGRLTSRGGPHHPAAGAYEEHKPDRSSGGETPSRLHGIEDLKTASMCYGPADAMNCDFNMPMVNALGMKNGGSDFIPRPVDFIEVSRG